ncbi:MAG: sigma-54 dependent transcriptional regulator [Gemmataceae bacterium]|nr:sigma-54 dependent transcriptional regulator [Gemmataceae bacterium]
MPILLAIDDEPLILACLRSLFREPEVTLLTATSAADGLRQFAAHRPDVVLLDVRLPDLSGLEALRRLQELDAKVPVILVTGHGTASTAIEAMRLGAYEYVLKPLDPDPLAELVHRAFQTSRLMRVPAKVTESAGEEETADLLIGRTPAMHDVYKAIGRVAPQDITVLILGESGTGKELVARAIYHYSRRGHGRFLAINCAALPESLLESELFGHEKGAFTGADRKRIGKFEQCHGGTLFLDEVGDMTPLTQTKVLRLLQEQQFERVGGNETITSDVRLIAATNRNLEQLISAGRFRSDLYYRLNVFSITLPPLRERAEDLPILVDHFLRRFRRELGKDVQEVAPEALDQLRRYLWPGNVRELQAVLKQALVQTVGTILLPQSLPPILRGEESVAPALHAAPVPWKREDLTRFVHDRLRDGSTNLHAEFLALTERYLLTEVLRHTGGNQSQAARILGISRATLRTKLAALDLGIERSLIGDDEPAAEQG